MQDLIEDWRIESDLMGGIYGNSLCNIAATGSADGNGGISMNGWSLLNLPCFGESIPHFDSPGSWHISPRYLLEASFILDSPLLA
jgi:hypothetical protein